MKNDPPYIETRVSEDGSSTLYRPDIDEHYHSFHGAIQESEHVFIRPGLNYFMAPRVSILEIGFGTGLNALLSLIHGKKCQIHYHAIEKWPVPPDLLEQLNYPAILESIDPEAGKYFRQIHQCKWESLTQLNPFFEIYKEQTDLRDFHNKENFDIVYFDAFAPDKQPELWTPPIIQNICQAINHGGILTTYTAKGTVKRALKEAGMRVEKIPGPPGKRDMIRAIKQ